MPVSVAKRGNQWCVVEPDGKQIACHDTEAGAQAQARAINANTEKTMIHVWKGQRGLRRMVLLSSNSYMDREGEIVKQKALEAHVKRFDPSEFHPLLFWHAGEPIGRIVEARMYGKFLFEVAEELPNSLINLAKQNEPPFFVSRKDVWDAIETYPSMWGVSIGFKHRVGDEQDKAFDTIFKFESSVLPIESAANAITLSVLIPEKE